ncbi:MAG: amino acid ABC transporter ATP-binding protein [Betaproteobacteria bacterium]
MKPPSGAQPLLELRGLRKSFGASEVVRGVDLAVVPRELVFVIGPSGSGKSTLLRMCNRLEEPSAGEIWFEGQNILAPGTDLNAVRRRIGMVFQSFNLYPHLNARDNVALALIHVLKQPREEAHARAVESLRKVGLGDRGEAKPAELSGGQQQRVAIARALALEPAIVLFDEPTSALDPELVGSVLAVLRELRSSGMTMMVVSHEMGFARGAADRVVFMESGRILADGPPEIIFGAGAPQRIREFVASVEHR